MYLNVEMKLWELKKTTRLTYNRNLSEQLCKMMNENGFDEIKVAVKTGK